MKRALEILKRLTELSLTIIAFSILAQAKGADLFVQSPPEREHFAAENSNPRYSQLSFSGASSERTSVVPLERTAYHHISLLRRQKPALSRILPLKNIEKSQGKEPEPREQQSEENEDSTDVLNEQELYNQGVEYTSPSLESGFSPLNNFS